MKVRILSSIDYLLFFCILSLSVIGIFFIYSSGINAEGVLVSDEYIRQIIWVAVGLAVMLIVTFIDYRRYERYANYMFLIMILLLIYTRIFGRYVNGARSWIGIGDLGIQPSELMKIVFILFLARYLNRSAKENPKRRFVFSLFIMLVPVGLILLQPDLGTASVFIPIYLFMGFMADIPLRYLMSVILTGLISIVLTVLPIWEAEILGHSLAVIRVLTETKLRLIVLAASLVIFTIGLLGSIFFKKKYYYWVAYFSAIFSFSLAASYAFGKVLQPYQIARLIVFIDPNSDPQGAGWNIIQSKTAIGAGRFFGRGFMQGSQSHLRFLPQQSTDFIFSIFSEEMGFAGDIVLFTIFFVILMKIVYIIRRTSNPYGCYIASGILGILFFHFIVNIGMVMGIMPITGIPLPFLSYGGSALITNMIAIGILMNISKRRAN